MEQNKNVWIWAFAALVLLLLFGSFGMGGYSMMGYGPGFGWIFMLLFLGVLIWLAYALITAFQSNTQPGQEADSMELIKKRYAKGEISKKQYEEMKKDLRGE